MENKIELLGYYGSDELIACSAWTSTSRDITPEKRERIPKLLKSLALAGHHTPFEKSSLHFLANTEIATHIQLLKHRVGVSINGESARYKELKEDKTYIPKDWVGIEVESMDFDCRDRFGYTWDKVLQNYTDYGNELYHAALKDLEFKLGRKRAKESSRFFKTYNSQIQADIMFNWRSFYHFLQLRNKPDAQLEIKEAAVEMLNLVKNIEGSPFKFTIEAFNL